MRPDSLGSGAQALLISRPGCRLEKLRVDLLSPHLSIVLGEGGASQPLGGFDIPQSRLLHYVFGQLGGRGLVVPLL